MRMGVPDDFVRYQTKLTIQTRTAVITPFGVTDKLNDEMAYLKMEFYYEISFSFMANRPWTAAI